jgi:leader peptidase (prepilin peptidase) / N-methyltransferase
VGVTTAVVLASALLGLLLGSFLNVVVHRVPRGESVASPPSACPRCGTRIAARDNVPVLSWLLLRGRCRSCRAPISPRYPLVEAGTAGLFAVVALRFADDLAVLPAYLYLAAVGLALALIDIDVKRLPNALTYPSYPVAVALLGLASLLGAESGSFLRALLGGVVALALYLALVLAYPAGMGLGDLKLSGVLGLYLGWLGWGVLALGLFLGFLLGGVFGVVLIALGRGGRKSKVPFGPFMIGGALLAVLVGQPLVDAYLGLLGA